MLFVYETSSAHSRRLKLRFEKRRNESIALASLGLVLILCVLPTQACKVFSTSKLIDYVDYDDQEYAENKYLDMGPMRAYRKIVYKTVPVNASTVCNMTNEDVTKLCHEIALYRRARNALQNRYVTQEDLEPAECTEYPLKLECDYFPVDKRLGPVTVRKCPTRPTLYISEGRNIGGVFVYATRVKGRKLLKLIDYITFLERTAPIMS